MAKRRPVFDSLEQRLCLASPVLEANLTLPAGSWTKTAYRSSPIYADIFNIGQDDLITVAAGAQLVAFRAGTTTPIITYHVPNGVADIKTTPIVVLDPRTGRKDLFAAMGRDETHDGTLEDSRVFGWDLQTGVLLPAWANGVSDGDSAGGLTGSYGPLASGDLTGGGVPDIIVTSFSLEVTAYTLDGAILWQWENNDTIVSGAVVADIDRDGKPEVIVGGDSSANTVFTQFQQGGWVNVLSNTGQLKWRRQIPGEVTWSSPVVADLNNNGYLDIVIGTGDNFASTLSGAAQAAAINAGNNLYAFDPFGNLLPGWPYHTSPAGSLSPREVLATPVVADLQGNGQLDVIALDRQGYIHVIQPNGQDLPAFAGGRNLVPEYPPTQLPDDYGSPIVADINGDGKPEIIATYGFAVRAFDANGNLIAIGTSPPSADGGLPEAFDSAPAVGNFDGSGGLSLAVVSVNLIPVGGDITNPPDQVQIYKLAQSSLAPPWPMQRKSASGVPIQRSTVYDHQYIVSAFSTLMGSQPIPALIQIYQNALDTNQTNLLSTSQLIASSTEVRQSEVGRIYQSYLGHPADAFALSYWSGFLASHSYRQMETLVASSGEFAQRAGGSAAQEVVQVYQAALGRTPGPAEAQAWVNTRLPIGTVANAILNSSEGITHSYNGVVQAIFGPGTQGFIPPDDLAAYSYDIHTGEGDENIIANILASEGNYAATDFVPGYIMNLYRDVIGRQGAPSEVAFWVTQIDQGSVAFGNVATLFLNSTEGRMNFVQTEFVRLLGHTTDVGTLTSLANYSTRENIDILLTSSAEYFVKNGNSNAGFVAAAFRDLGGITADQGTINGFAAQLNAGLTRAQLAQMIIKGPLYINNTVINQLMFYIPDESQGVLRTGDAPLNAPGQPINPPPSLVNYFAGLYAAGLTDEQVLSLMLNTPQYYSTASYYRGLFRALGVRF